MHDILYFILKFRRMVSQIENKIEFSAFVAID